MKLSRPGAYYRRISKELAREFKQRLTAALEDIKRNPETWSSMDDKYHRKLMKQFPCGVIYHLPKTGYVEVVAVIHFSREPDYGRGRGA